MSDNSRFSPQSLPPGLEDLPELALKYGGEVWIEGNTSSTDKFSAADIAALTDLYERLRANDRWKDVCRAVCAASDFTGSGNAVPLPNRIFNLFGVFDALGRRRIRPFTDKVVRFVEEPLPCDWSTVPPDLMFLRDAAERYGGWLEDDLPRYGRSARVKSTLQNLAQKMLREPSIFDHFTSWVKNADPSNGVVVRLHRLFQLMDELGISYGG